MRWRRSHLVLLLLLLRLRLRAREVVARAGEGGAGHRVVHPRRLRRRHRRRSRQPRSLRLAPDRPTQSENIRPWCESPRHPSGTAVPEWGDLWWMDCLVSRRWGQDTHLLLSEVGQGGSFLDQFVLAREHLSEALAQQLNQPILLRLPHFEVVAGARELVVEGLLALHHELLLVVNRPRQLEHLLLGQRERLGSRAFKAIALILLLDDALRQRRWERDPAHRRHFAGLAGAAPELLELRLERVQCRSPQLGLVRVYLRVLLVSHGGELRRAGAVRRERRRVKES
eukprot:404048-Prorocentrum_minimum.AAC.1